MLQGDIEINRWVQRVLYDDRRTPRRWSSAEAPPAVRAGARPGSELDLHWCPVPGGLSQLSDHDSTEPGAAGRTALLTPFEMTQVPISRRQYEAFVADGGYDDERHWTVYGWRHRRSSGWNGPAPSDDPTPSPDAPVTGVSWWEAMAFACWVDALLPSEAQWECAARYGDPAADDLIDLREPDPRPTSPFGCLDMNGQVAEWCLDNDGTWPPGADLLVDPVLETAETAPHIARGGCGLHAASALCGNSRDHHRPGFRDHLLGFRLVRPAG